MRFLLIISAVLAVDQVSKYIVQMNMLRGESIPIIYSVFHLTYIQNPGAAFGIFANQRAFFVVVTVIVLAGILISYRYIPSSNEPMRVSLGLITGGALGNFIDRLRLGRVVDFLDFRVWPVFNLADTAIVIGAGLLIWQIWKSEGEEEKVNGDAES
ncbi:MAG: signal peptidase II [Firmicutes bacterium]|nr:signal peptidase II [Bacillota bacterium]